jgi:hypothetical protein
MSTAIHTKYFGPGPRRGARIKAFCKGGTGDFVLTVDYPHDRHQDEKHVVPAKALAERLRWAGLWIVGHNEDGSISCANLPGSYSRAWVDKYIPGKENADWFFIEESAR